MRAATKEYPEDSAELCYLMGDQPTTCGICGTRTSFEEIGDLLQSHKCLNPTCGYVFYIVDEEF